VTPTIGETLLQTRATLAHSGISEAPLEAELLLGMTLGLNRPRLHASLSEDVPEGCQQALERLVQRRLNREPLAYLLRMREFFGLEFQVGPGVFIPRPETELLVEQAVSMVRTRFPQGDAIIADVGTGSGAVAVSLAVHLARSRLYATDISRTALDTARANAQVHGVHERITFLCGDLLEPLPQPGNLVVANLPYIRSRTIPFLEPEISQFEPREALDGGTDGLNLVRRLIRQGPDHLSAEAAILLELDPDQMDAAEGAARAVYPRAQMRRFRDLAGNERVLVIDLPAP